MDKKIITQHISACPLNCWDACSFKVTVVDGKVSKVEGNKEHPVTEGKICGRGRMLAERTNHQERLTVPLKKVNESWEEITWEQALQEIAGKLDHAKELFGPTSVLHSHDYSNNGLLKNIDERFFRAFGGWTKVEGSLCWGAGIEAQVRDFGNSLAHAPEDILNSRHVVVWGRNVARTNMHLLGYLKKAKKKGIKLTVIDPYRNQTAEMADHFVSVRPGSDGFLAAGIIKAVLKNGREDYTFIKEATYGFETLKKELDSVSLEFIQRTTGVSIEEINRLAEIYTERPVTTYAGLGMQRYKNGGNTIRLIDALGAISGNIGIPGGGVNYGNLAAGQSFNTAELALRSKEAEIRTFTRMNQAEKILTATEPPVEVIVVSRSNPLTQLPNTNLAEKAFKKAGTVVVMDQYMTDTAEEADYVLPVTSVFEEEDIYYASMYHSYANYGPKLSEPPGQAKSDLWIWTQLAEKLGFGEYFNYSLSEWLSIGTESLRKKGWSVEKLKEQGFLKLPVKEIPWSSLKFQTPTGKYEFYSKRAESMKEEGAVQLLHPSEAGDTDKELAEKYPYLLLSLHPLRSNHSQHYLHINARDYNVIEVSSDIAENIDLKNDDNVRVWNERGEITGKVKIQPGLHSSTLNIDEGRGKRFGGSVNVLTPHGESDMGQGSILYDCRVSIEKA
jgi:anaerobic selenocysteine-containing dehydrogenase